MIAACQLAVKKRIPEEQAYYEYIDLCKRYYQLAEYAPQQYVVEGDPNMLHKLSDYADAGVRRVSVVDPVDNMVDAFDRWLQIEGYSKCGGNEHEK